jgi:hypothetical protein
MDSAKEFPREKRKIKSANEKGDFCGCAMNFLLCVFVYYMHRVLGLV